MKKSLGAILVLALFVTSPVWALSIGAKAPTGEWTTGMVDVTGADAKNFDKTKKTTSIAKEKGANGTLVIFSCNTCPYVIKWKDRMSAQIKAYKKNGFGVIVINSNARKRGGVDSPEKMLAFAQAEGYNVPYVIDTNNVVADGFGATRTPEVFLFDKEDKLVYHGAIDDDADAKKVKDRYLAKAMVAVLAKKKPDPSETPSVGCGIKKKKNKKK